MLISWWLSYRGSLEMQIQKRTSMPWGDLSTPKHCGHVVRAPYDQPNPIKKFLRSEVLWSI